MYSKTFPRNTSSFYVCSPPSGGRFWYRVPSKEQGKGPPERTKRAGAVSRTEDASGAAGGCFWHGTPLKMRPVRQEAVHSLWSRLFCGPLKTHSVQQVLFCGPLKMRRVPEEAVFGTEYLFRTVEAYFEHRVPQKTPSVQKKGVFMHRMPFPYRKSLFFAPNASENASRTPGSLFEHGTHIPYRKSLFLVPSPLKPSRSSLTLLKSAFIVTICFQMITFPYVASTPLHITRG